MFKKSNGYLWDVMENEIKGFKEKKLEIKKNILRRAKLKIRIKYNMVILSWLEILAHCIRLFRF